MPLSSDCALTGIRPWHRAPLRNDSGGRRYGADRRLEIHGGGPRQLRAELVAKHFAPDFVDFPFGEVAELERPIGNPDQAVG
jgi:hypothetical protein